MAISRKLTDGELRVLIAEDYRQHSLRSRKTVGLNDQETSGSRLTEAELRALVEEDDRLHAAESGASAAIRVPVSDCRRQIIELLGLPGPKSIKN